jgi:hypothetical protein
MDKYMEDAARTAGDGTKFHTEVVPLSFLVDSLESLMILAPFIDQAKKGLFYGKDTETLKFARDVATGSPNEYHGVDIVLVHALLGTLTEANELGELLLEHLKNKKSVDDLRAKLVDESGDVLWYLAMLYRKLGISFEEVGSLNI